MNRVELSTRERNRKTPNLAGRRFSVSGAIMIAAAFLFRQSLTSVSRGALYLLGSVCCITGVAICILKEIMALHSRKHEHNRRVSAKNGNQSKHTKKTFLWLGSIAVSFLLALATGELHILTISILILISGFISILVSRIKKQFADIGRKNPYGYPEFVIDKVKLLNCYTTTKQGSLDGAILGGLLGGGIGAVLGSMLPSGKQVHWQQFAIKYTNGRTSTESHPIGSRRYIELMQYVHLDDL